MTSDERTQYKVQKITIKSNKDKSAVFEGRSSTTGNTEKYAIPLNDHAANEMMNDALISALSNGNTIDFKITGSNIDGAPTIQSLTLHKKTS